MNYLEIANSPILFIVCLIPIVAAMIQAFGFLRMASKEAKTQQISDDTVKKVIANSAIFSIVPSLPIIFVLAALMAILGKYIPWLRLSVMGSAAYESFAADLTIKAFGLPGGPWRRRADAIRVRQRGVGDDPGHHGRPYRKHSVPENL